MSGINIFRRAETAYQQGNTKETFDLYQKAIQKIIRNENLSQETSVPSGGEYNKFPKELLGIIWRQFNGFFRDHSMPQFSKGMMFVISLTYANQSIRP
jgi:hypothetical protein